MFLDALLTFAPVLAVLGLAVWGMKRLQRWRRRRRR